MIATQVNPLILSGSLQKMGIVRVTDAIQNEISGKKILIILGLEVVSGPQDAIGNPVLFGSSGATSQPSNTAAASGASAAAAAPYAAAAARPAPAPAAAGFNPANNYATTGVTNAMQGVVQRAAAGGPASAVMSQFNLVPIAALTMYSQKVAIKARVTARTDMKTYTNPKGNGKLFSCDLLDDQGGEIRLTAFNDTAERYYPLLEVGKVVYLGKFQCKFAQKKYNTLKHDYEISLNSDSVVEPCPEDDSIARMRWAFVPLSGLSKCAADSLLDVIGVVHESGQLSVIKTKKGDELSKRDLVLVDNSAPGVTSGVRITLWGRQADSWAGDSHPVVAFKGVKVGDFGGKSLSVLNSSHVELNPVELPEAATLRAWYDAEGSSSKPQFPSGEGGAGGAGGAGGSGGRVDPSKTIDEVTAEAPAHENGVYFRCRATVTMANSTSDKHWYAACPNGECNKKVTEEGDGNWSCEKCQRKYPAPNYRYLLNLQITDFTNSTYATAFDDMGAKIMGHTANELHLMKEEDHAGYEAAFERILMKQFSFKLRAKTDSYNGQQRIKTSILEAEPIDFQRDTLAILDMIKAM
jgi:replication factor A1